MKPVMLATDGSPTARRATSAAVNIAPQLCTDLVVVTVWHTPFGGYGPPGFMPVAGYGNLTELSEMQARTIASVREARAEVCSAKQFSSSPRRRVVSSRKTRKSSPGVMSA
jgi:hypothetical protein